ncbi:MAG: sodium:proton exchanger [Candidatus Buchananbacteria bacterium RIFCSPHIGHO2_01_FULL_44_11]|uniref:Sodium:proton exchanger n=1 Tax=Candidatus Buchananbacteria bacterium RIFCSPHIGHO2_01_FULL_44_11 TaxID=1797535 RepID=A0A1G1XZW4_9BACT|nr:MAG: sodium:proton exchanger [Candidatus Buchananbacteria bacterium RIFCSPHIGHO2_01_FULL_44_11]
MIFVYLVIGFALLVKGADLLVDGASALARKLKISDLVIGLTIVSFGTSAPELIVNIVASLSGQTEIAIGNILGSNIVNIFFILGVSAVIYNLTVTKGTVWKEIPFSLLAVLAFGLLANDSLVDGLDHSTLTRSDGFILIAFFVIFMYYIFGIAKVQGANTEDVVVKPRTIPVSVFFILAGLAALVFGGKLVVDNAVALALNLGVSSSLIGLTIVAIGTSLPELATSAVAAYRKNVDIAVGNVVGSNIFNIFWILGLSAIINPLPFLPQANFDILMAMLASLLLFAFMFIGRRRILERWQGAMFILIYVLYVIFLIIRG